MKKIIYVGIFFACLIVIVSIFFVFSINEEKKEIVKLDKLKISGCFDTFFGHGNKVEQGYVTLEYDYLLKNIKNQKNSYVLDWGDETSTTIDDVRGSIYVPHTYDKSGTYNILVKSSDEKDWSEPFSIGMLDFYDISAEDVYIKSSIFRPRQRIALCADLKNIGNIPTINHVKVVFYHVEKRDSKVIIAESEVGIIKPGNTKTVEIPFKWFNDKNQHKILVEVEGLNGERTTVNNIECGSFTAGGFIKTCLSALKSRVNGFLGELQN